MSKFAVSKVKTESHDAICCEMCIDDLLRHVILPARALMSPFIVFRKLTWHAYRDCRVVHRSHSSCSRYRVSQSLSLLSSSLSSELLGT